MSTDELLVNALRILEIYLSVNNNSCGKLPLSLESPIMLGDNLITTSFSFFIADFNLFSCEFYNFVFKRLYCVILHYQELKSQLHSQNFYGSL